MMLGTHTLPFISKPKFLTPKHEEFLDDMVDFFAGLRGGHIARHGYVGKGGQYYSRWLAENHIYRSQITLAEIELITAHIDVLANICGETVNFVEAGFGSVNAFLNKTYPLLRKITQKTKKPLQYKIADVSEDSFDTARKYIVQQELPFKPSFIQCNFFDGLPELEKDSTIYCAGLTFTNIPADAIHRRTEDILTDVLFRFSRTLKKGGTLIFSYADDSGVGLDGKEIKAFYEHPLIHSYQLSIFDRVAQELPVDRRYEAKNFYEIEHTWHPENYVLTRHVSTKRPMRFDIGGYELIIPKGFKGYMANNFRFPDDMVTTSAKKAGFNDSHILRLPNSSLRLVALKI